MFRTKTVKPTITITLLLMSNRYMLTLEQNGVRKNGIIFTKVTTQK